MKRKTARYGIALLAAVVLAAVSLAVVGGPPRIEGLGPRPDGWMASRVGVDTAGVYLVQWSTNLTRWTNVVAVYANTNAFEFVDPDAVSNRQAFYRTLRLDGLTDTNPPAWAGGLQVELFKPEAGGLFLRWKRAADGTGVAGYRIYVDGAVVTNLPGNVPFCLLPGMRMSDRHDIRIEAFDASGNTTGVRSLMYVPGRTIGMVADDGGRTYVFWTQADGSLSPLTRLVDIGWNTRGGAVGDFDGDDVLDIVTGYGGDGTIRPYLLRGRGDGTFEAPAALTANAGSSGWIMGGAAGDYDADGCLDFMLNGNNGTLAFYWGRGDGTFDLAAAAYPSSGRDMDTGDFNEDGFDDFVRATHGDGYVRQYLSRGDRTFYETNVVGDAGDDPYGVATGDFDEDGHLDVMAISGGSGYISLWAGRGDGTFTNGVAVTNLMALTSGNHGAMDAYDYNGDGHLDVVLANYSWRQVIFWPGRGDGTFGAGIINSNQPSSAAMGLASPPLPPRVDVGVVPDTPVIPLNGAVAFGAVGSGISSNDSFVWSIVGGSSSTGMSVTNTFVEEGVFLAHLLHTSTGGVKSARGTRVRVRGQPPVAAPGGPYTLGESAVRQMQWTAALNGGASTDDFGIVRYFWNFGDGTMATGTTPQVSHTWSGEGPWTVWLTVEDKSGLTGSNSTTVTFVPGAPPTAAIAGPSVIDEARATNGSWYAGFSAAGSTDDVGVWKYQWDFGNGQSATAPDTRTTYGGVSTYRVTLTVWDHAGQTDSTTHDIETRANGIPTPGIAGSRFLNEVVATNGYWYGAWDGNTRSTDDWGIARFVWSFGDGSASATGPIATHQYAAPGVYRLSLTVVDNANQPATITQNVVVVTDDPPIARMAPAGATAEGWQWINLSGEGSTDDHGLSAYRWYLPASYYPFTGSFVDQRQWRAGRTLQADRMILTGDSSWGHTYFYSVPVRVQRGSTFEGRIDTGVGYTHGMVGLKDLSGSPQYSHYVYALYFADGAIHIYEYGGSRGQRGSYVRGDSYDFRLETKPGSGVRYWVRPSNTNAAYTLLLDSTAYADTEFTFGADVYSSTFAFDDFFVSGGYAEGSNITVAVHPGGPVTLEVVDNGSQTNRTTALFQSITGSPPRAVVAGASGGATSIQLLFDGYDSQDDYGIASYLWDFGDGSTQAVGPVAVHAFNAASNYTVRLTVMDYAGQADTATHAVSVTGSASVVAVPWQILGGVELPHETYNAHTVTLKAVAARLSVPFDYAWDFGDGSAAATGTVTTTNGAYGIEARHAYTGADNTPFFATITVIQTNGVRASDTYPILLRQKTLEVEMDVAIDEGLWFLHKQQNRRSYPTYDDGYWVYSSVGTYYVSPSASAVQAFEINGHIENGDPEQDPYVETVKRGMNYLLTAIGTREIGSTPFGDADSNGNGIGLEAGNQPIYELGQVMDAIVAGGTPDAVAQVGGANVYGRTYREIVQDMVDMYCWGQYDGSCGGGWRYGWNDWPDNSASQWASVGLLAAERYWGLAVPSWAKSWNKVWCQYSKGSTGFGYTGSGDGEATTPSALVQLSWNGTDTSDALWVHGEKYLEDNWNWLMSVYNLYSSYAVSKAMRTANPVPVTRFRTSGLDWFMDPARGLARNLIDRQYSDGSWLGSGRGNERDSRLSTAWGVIILSSSLFTQGPVAIVRARPNPTAVGFPVSFDARESYHRHRSFRISEYRWDFDASDGLDFDHPDATGPVVSNAFGAITNVLVTLQVRDNGTPTAYDTASVQVQVSRGAHPPTAEASGPYVGAVGEAITLDGSGSFDVDAADGDSIQSWEWETDFQQPLDFSDGFSGPTVVVPGNYYPTPGRRQVGLRVKDRTAQVFPGAGPDQTATDFATLILYTPTVSNLAARPKRTKCQLTWNWSQGYECAVMRSEVGPNRGFIEVGRTQSGYATFLDESIQLNRDYYYRIYVYDLGGRDPIGISPVRYVRSQQRGIDNWPPRFYGTPTPGAVVGGLYEVQLQAQDPESDPMTFSLAMAPTGMTVGVSNGIVRFTPTPDQVGTHEIIAEVRDAAGMDVLDYYLVVFPASNRAPVAVANGPYAGLTGQPIAFSSAGTFDPDGNPVRYAWNFGDGGTATNAHPAHVYGGAGQYVASLFVSDSYGGTASTQAFVVIERPNREPVAVVAGGPQFVTRLGLPLWLDGRASYDPDGDDIVLSWSWGDGRPETNGNAQVSRIYGALGRFDGGLTVADGRGGTNTYPFVVTVGPSNRPPAAVFSVTNAAGPHVLSRHLFDASATTDAEGDPMVFSWDFGDRVRTTGIIVTHVYRQRGDYPVVLTVRDNQQGETVVTQVVSIVNAPPVFTSTPPIWASETVPYVYEPGVFDVDGDRVGFSLATNPPAMTIDPDTGRIDWTPLSEDIGPHPIVVRVTDTNGASGEQSYTLVVASAAGPSLDLEPVLIEGSNVLMDARTLSVGGTIEVRIVNNGTSAVPVPYTLTVFEDLDRDGAYSSTSDTRLGWANLGAGLQAGWIGIATIPLAGTASFRDVPLSAFVDSEGAVPEFDESNNVLRDGDDATGAAVDVSAAWLRDDRRGLPGQVALTARLGNSGAVSIPTNVAMSFYAGDPAHGGGLIGVAHPTNVLASGAFADLSVTWLNPAITAHTVFVRADDDGSGGAALAEANEANNGFSDTVDLMANEPPVADAGADQTAAVGYTYGLNGSDSADPEGKPLRYRWSVFAIPIGSQTALQGADTAGPLFAADVPGAYTFQLVVNDGVQDSAADSVTVTVVDPSANHPPEIVSRPSFVAMVSVPYGYAAAATDPDGDVVTWRLNQKPAGMTIATNSGVIAWTPTNAGAFFVQVIADDGRGGAFSQGYSLNVIPYQNLAPQITSTPVTLAQPGVAYRYDVDATDFNRTDTLTYALPERPSGMSIASGTGLISWTPSGGQLGAHGVTVTVSDGRGGAATQAFDVVVVVSASNAPAVRRIPDQVVTDPAAFTAIALDGYVTDPDDPKSNLVWTASGNAAFTVSISGRVAYVTYPAGARASELVSFIATDPAGHSGFASPRFTVRGADNPPIAVIANLSDTDTTSIRDGFFELRGTADDPDAIDPVSWRVQLYDSDGKLVRDVTPAPLNAAGYHLGRVAPGGSFGALDLTMVRNGAYDLVLDVAGGARTAQAWAPIALDSGLKVGQMTFSQQDIVIPVNGIPLAVVRTYDSLNLESRDFGYGWTYTVADLNLKINEQRVRTADVFGLPFSLRTGGSRDVTLDMPDTGQRVTFRQSFVGGGMFRQQAIWTPPPGVHASLVPTCNPNVIKLWGLPPYWEAAGIGTAMENFDVPGFILTTADGTRYQVDRDDQGEFYIDSNGNSYGFYVHAYGDAHVRRISQPDGNRLDFVRTGAQLRGIEHYDNATNKTRSLVFGRDSEDRIVSVYTADRLDAGGNPSGPASVRYAYDGIGNLVKAERLVDAADTNSPVYVATGYVYGHPRYSHYITEIRDAQGLSAMRTEYDADGRVVATVDVYGNRTELQHDLAARTETVYDRLGYPSLFVYDAKGNVTAATDPLGQTTSYGYDANGAIALMRDPLGRTTRYVNDAAGLVLAETTPGGFTYSYAYDGSGRQLTVTDPMGHVSSNGYDSEGRLVTLVNALGARIENQYDTRGNMVASVDPFGNVAARVTYDAQGNLTSMGSLFSSNDVVTTYDASGNPSGSLRQWVNPTNAADVRTISRQVFYNADGLPIRSVDSLGNETRMVYDTFGRVIETVDSNSNRTTYVYDSRGNIVASSLPGGGEIRVVYDELDREVIRTEVFRPGTPARATRLLFDAAGRVTQSQRLADVVVNVVTQGALVRSVVASAGGVLSSNVTVYDAVGQVVTETFENGGTFRYEYDAEGHRTAVIDPLGGRTETEYDAAGNVTLLRDPEGLETRTLYDAVGRPVRTVFADGTSVRRRYDLGGREIEQTDAAGFVKALEYDDAGRLTAVSLPAVPDPLASNALVRPRYEYEYDGNGNLILIRDPRGRVTRFAFDEYNRPVARTLPMGQTDRLLYNAKGQLVRHVDFKGQAIELRYDPMGRVTNKLLYAAGSLTPSESVSVTYDEWGRQRQVIEGRGISEFEYDGEHNITRITTPEGTIRYAYDPASGLRTRTSSDFSETQYGYDELARLKTVAVTKRNGVVLAVPEITCYDYSPAGHRAAVTLPNGIRTEYAYDDQQRLVTMTHRAASNAVLATYGYGMNESGMRTAIAESVLKAGMPYRTTNAVAYTYDDLMRVTREAFGASPATDSYAADYVYDTAGNRLRRTVTVGSQSLKTYYVYDDNDRLLTESNVVTAAGAGAPGARPRGGPGWRPDLPPAPPAWLAYRHWMVLGAWSAIVLALYVAGCRASRRRGPAADLTTVTAVFIRRASLTRVTRATASVLAGLMAVGPVSDVAFAIPDAPDPVALGSWGSAGEVTTYEYDDNGALVRRVTSGPAPVTESYAYTLESRLAAVRTVRAGAQTVVTTSAYTYDQDGNRVRTVVTTEVDSVVSEVTTNICLIDPMNHTGYAQVMEERTAVGSAPVRTYVIGDDVISQTGGGGAPVTEYMLYDGHLSTRQLADAAQTITESYTYDAYGVMPAGNPTMAQPSRTSLLYSGEAFDAPTQHYYLRARYYNPSNGRFTQMDPADGQGSDPQSLHKYAYAHGNPVNGIDPGGREFNLIAVMMRLAVHSIIMQIVGIAIGAAFKRFGGFLVPKWVWDGLEKWGPSAMVLGFSLSGAIPKAKILDLTGGIEFLVGLGTLNLGIYAYVGGGFHGSSVGSGWDASAYLGLVFHSPTSLSYEGPFASVGLSGAALPDSVLKKMLGVLNNKSKTRLYANKLRNALGMSSQLRGDLNSYFGGGLSYEALILSLLTSGNPAVDTINNQISKMQINIFFGPALENWKKITGLGSFGSSITVWNKSKRSGTPVFVTLAITVYFQIFAHDWSKGWSLKDWRDDVTF